MTVQTSARGGMVAGYLRVSSRSQDVATQRSTILRRAAIDDVPAEAIAWYEEQRSARTLDRVALRNLRVDIRAGKIATLYTFRIDRLARTGIRDVLELVDEARLAGCRIWSTSEGIEVTGKAYELIVSALAWAAELELEAHAERRGEARARMEEEGRSWGRPRKLSAVDEDRMLELQRSGLSVRVIAARVGVPRATVFDCLERARARNPDPVRPETPPAGDPA